MAERGAEKRERAPQPPRSIGHGAGDATTRAKDEVLIVTSHHRNRIRDRQQPEDHDESPSFGPVHFNDPGQSERSNGASVDRPVGSLPDNSAAASAVLRPSPSLSSAIPSLAQRTGDGMTAWTVEIILAYLATNTIGPTDLPKLISDLNKVLREVSEKDVPSENGLRPAVPVSKSLTPDYIVCLEDGRRFKSMRRHLKAAYNLSPEEYRRKWGLPVTYPMIAPNYAKLCSDRAKEQGLGRSQ